MAASLPIRITLQMLHDTFAKFPDAVAPTKENKSFYLAVAVLKHFFGEGWIEHYLDRPSYLQIDETNQTTMDLKGLRLIDLAEVIYNLQYVENFDNCISRMRDGDIEGTAAELDLGRMLYLNQVSFRYIVPTGAKGKDYDAEILFPDGTGPRCAVLSRYRHQCEPFEASLRVPGRRVQGPASRPTISHVGGSRHEFGSIFGCVPGKNDIAGQAREEKDDMSRRVPRCRSFELLPIASCAAQHIVRARRLVAVCPPWAFPP